jgi:hypothetical protein
MAAVLPRSPQQQQQQQSSRHSSSSSHCGPSLVWMM